MDDGCHPHARGHHHDPWVEAGGAILFGMLSALLVWGTAAVFGVAWAIFTFCARVLS